MAAAAVEVSETGGAGVCVDAGPAVIRWPAAVGHGWVDRRCAFEDRCRR
jgi:hypothetical protein